MRRLPPDLCFKCDRTEFTQPKYIPAYVPALPVQELYKPEHLLYTCITCGFEIDTRCKDATDEQWKVYEELHP